MSKDNFFYFSDAIYSHLVHKLIKISRHVKSICAYLPNQTVVSYLIIIIAQRSCIV